MKLTWYGHSTFRIETGGAVVLVDPFLKGNPTFEACGVSFDEAIAGATHVALTHGHDDHIGSAGEICKTTGATLVAVFELAMHIKEQGAEKIEPTNTGGSVVSNGVRFTFTDALHSSSSGGVYLGNPCGIVIEAADGSGKRVYHMGDTDVFPGMELVQKLHQPNVGLVPIGDRFTMGAKTAAFACKTYFSFETVIPCHFGTFPIIDQTADAFVSEMAGQSVTVAEPGKPIDL
jgi:L-ascorbate metabolism protein UlaG (beta-lactamase superfamily)